MSVEKRIAEVLRRHPWWLAGNLGVPGMPDWTTYKCSCGWNGDEPDGHVASVLVDELGLAQEWAPAGMSGYPATEYEFDERQEAEAESAMLRAAGVIRSSLLTTRYTTAWEPA